jgi:formylglycine-generating enzyme required for sulfatase activity/serine/threonine protein kinase
MATASQAPFDPWLTRVLGGRYSLVAAIGRGGMGVVYRAWDRIENRYAVVKMPRAELLSQGQFRERFAHELEVVRGLWHAAIVPVVDIGEEPLEGTASGFGMPYAVMPYLAGGSLSRRQRKRDGTAVPDAPESLWMWLPQIAEALDYVHSEGLVHRDVKPDNILFDGLGDPHLGDFGIAKVVLQAEAETRGLTKTGMSIGTPEYMAPELVAGATPDGRADQYALAVTVFEMLAGRKPFVANNPAAVLVQQATVPAPRLDSIRRGLPPSLVDAIDRALEKKPESRFSSCEGFVHALLAEVAKPAEAQKLRLMCPDCGELLKVKPSWAGQKGKCPSCTKQLVVSTDLRSLWLDSDRSQATTVEPAEQRSTLRDAFGWLNRQGIAIGLVMGLAALIPWLLIASGFTSLRDADGLIQAVQDKQTVLQQLAVSSAGEEATAQSLKQTQEEVRRLREQLEQAAIDMAEQIETSKAREAELQQALAAQQELAESRLAMLKKSEGETAEPKPTETSDEPIDLQETLVNSIGIELKLIPAGAFTMGQAGDDSDETPHEVTLTHKPHKVTLTKPIYMGVHEVTNAQWEQVMGGVPSSRKDANLPVENVNWDEVHEFCQRLSALPDEKQAGRVYRLPTEAEWEYACRAGTTTQWSFGDDDSMLGEYAWFRGNSSRVTHPVGTKKPNAWGLFDMHGNVWEWCSDGYSNGYSNFKKSAVHDPREPSRGPGRVIRGGGFGDVAGPCRSASRNGVQSARFIWLGIRLALSPSVAKPVPPEAATPVSQPEDRSPRDLTPVGLNPADARALQKQKAEALGLELEITNSIGMTLIAIPPGTFIMGSAEDGLVTHQVTLSQPFYLGIHEVTNGQWLSVMGSVPSRWKDGNRPVETVDWHDVNEFCRRLSSLPEEEQEGRVYRLPTESEWEYACRAGTTTSYSYGDDEGQLGDYAWFANNSGNVVLDAKKLLLASKDKRSNDDRLERYQCRTHPVGRKRPNSWGLFDMHGNVWEWCSDWYGGYPMVAVTDPQGPVQGSVRIRRGGPWNDPAECCRSAYRDFREPTHTSHSLGFRLALSCSGVEPVPREAASVTGN